MRLLRAFAVVVAVTLVAAAAYLAVSVMRDRAETTRTTARFDPPVWAGQNVPGACSGGFYARDRQTIVLTIVAHCATPGATLRGSDGRLVGIFGRAAELSNCPAGRFCSPSELPSCLRCARRVT